MKPENSLKIAKQVRTVCTNLVKKSPPVATIEHGKLMDVFSVGVKTSEIQLLISIEGISRRIHFKRPTKIVSRQTDYIIPHQKPAVQHGESCENATEPPHSFRKLTLTFRTPLKVIRTAADVSSFKCFGDFYFLFAGFLSPICSVEYKPQLRFLHSYINSGSCQRSECSQSQ